MPFSPRGNEVAAVIEIINAEVPLIDDERRPVLDEEGSPVMVPAYESAQKMANALLRRMAVLFAERDTFAVFPQGGVVGYGPYWSQADAEKAWVDNRIGETYGSQGRLLRVRPFNPTDAERGGTCVCTHSRDIHQDKGKCAAFMVGGTGPKAKTRPNMPQCGCSGFEQRKV